MFSFRRPKTTPQPVVQEPVLAKDLLGGMVLADGRFVAGTVHGERGDLTGGPVDRSAGRWCGVCGRHGSHHTDRHDEFVLVKVWVQDRATGDSETLILAGNEPVFLAPHWSGERA